MALLVLIFFLEDLFFTDQMHLLLVGPDVVRVVLFVFLVVLLHSVQLHLLVFRQRLRHSAFELDQGYDFREKFDLKLVPQQSFVGPAHDLEIERLALVILSQLNHLVEEVYAGWRVQSRCKFHLNEYRVEGLRPPEGWRQLSYFRRVIMLTGVLLPFLCLFILLLLVLFGQFLVNLINEEHELVLPLAHTLNTHDSPSLGFLIHLPIESFTCGQAVFDHVISAFKVVVGE